jgi:hypothetical protein
MVDEDLVDSCSNRCTSGSKRCVNGQWDTSSCPPVTVQCCSNSECGLCQECVAGKCVNQGAGQDKKGECDSSNPSTCRTGDCDGNGGCQKRVGNSCDGADLIVCNAGGTGIRQTCPSGQCSNNQCTGCGALSQPCCAGTCNAGNACIGNQCVACGGLNQPCCAGNSCGSGNMCSGGTCVTSCVAGGPCGPTNDMCKSGHYSCATGSQVCVMAATNEGLMCSPVVCNGSTELVVGKCSAGSCVQMLSQSCGSTKSCVNNQCKKNDGQRCSSNSECAFSACHGPQFCNGGSNAHCPCTGTDQFECESMSCAEDPSMKTCGGSNQCPIGWSCNGTPPDVNTCDVHN